MAQVTRNYVTFVAGAFKAQDSSADSVLFANLQATTVVVGIGTTKTLSIVGGFWDFNATRLTNIADGSANTDASSVGQLNTGLALKVSKAGDSMTGALTFDGVSGHIPTGLAAPTVASDAANKAYVDSVASGLDVRKHVRLYSNSNVSGTYSSGAHTLTTASATLTIDSVAVVNGDDVLLNGQTAQLQNGIFTVSGVGTAVVLTRRSDSNTSGTVNPGTFTFIAEGTTFSDTGWVQSTVAPTLETSSLVYVQFSSTGTIAAGAGLTKTGGTLSVNVDGTSTAIVGNNVAVRLDTAGAIIATGSGGTQGLAVQLESSNPTLQIASDKLGVKLDGAGAIVTGAAGIAVQLESSNPTLQISSDRLGAKLDGAGAIVTGAAGLKVAVDGSTITIASDQIGVPASGIGTSQLAAASVTAAKLATVTDGVTLDQAGASSTLEIKTGGVGTAQLAAQAVTAAKLGAVSGAGLGGGAGSAIAVNTGDGIQIDGSNNVAADFTTTFTNDNAGAITVRQLVYIKANGNVDLATAATATVDTLLALVATASIAAAGTGKIYVRPGALVGGFSSLVPGKRVFAHNATAGSFTQDPTTIGAGNNVYSVGRAISATQVVYNPEHIIQN